MDKMKRLNELKNEFVRKLNKLSFKDLVVLLGRTRDYECRKMITDTMEINYEKEFLAWIGEEV